MTALFFANQSMAHLSLTDKFDFDLIFVPAFFASSSTFALWNAMMVLSLTFSMKDSILQPLGTLAREGVQSDFVL